MTLAELNDRWSDTDLYRDCGETEIDRRTFYNHRIAISDQFGIDIQTIKAGPYSRYKIDKDSLNHNQIIDWLLSAIATENLITQSRNLSYKILLEPADKGAIHLNVITEALKFNRIIEIDYQSFHIGSHAQKSVTIEPLALKMFKRRWYLLSRKVETGDHRLYALDRMASCRLTEITFEYPADFKPEEYFANCFGVSTDGYTSTPCRIVLRAYHELPRYLESQPLHHTQEIVGEGESYTDFSYYIIPAFDFVQEILLHCEQFEVLSPLSLRQHVAKILNKSAEFYKREMMLPISDLTLWQNRQTMNEEKIKPETFSLGETIVTDIIWTSNSYGSLHPRVVFQPLKGFKNGKEYEFTQASGYACSFLKRLGISIGSKVEVYAAGGKV